MHVQPTHAVVTLSGCRLDDPCHTMHIQHSPTAQQGMAPFTPPAVTVSMVAAAPEAGRLPVTVSRVPREAAESLDSSGL